MWCGIASVVLAGLNVIWYYGLVHLYGFFTWIFIVALVTSALIYSFKDGNGRKMQNVIHNIRSKLLRKRQSTMKSSDYDNDKQLIHNDIQI
jgi:hypothetical protein